VLVTFKCNAPHADVTMFGTAATSLLKLMGQSGNVPGALMAEDIPAALKTLGEGIAARADQEGDDGTSVPAGENASDAGLIAPDGTGHPNADEEDDTRPVSLATRAAPLIGLLEAARDQGVSVRWDE